MNTHIKKQIYELHSLGWNAHEIMDFLNRNSGYTFTEETVIAVIFSKGIN